MTTLRAATVVVLATGLAFVLGDASAQYYPPGPAYYPPPPGQRMGPPQMAGEQDDGPDVYAPPPPPNYRGGPPQTVYPGQTQPYGQQQQAMPAPGTNFPPPANYPWVRERGYPSGPVVNAPATYDSQAPAGAPYQSGHMLQEQRPDVPRPPAQIEGAPTMGPGVHTNTAALPAEIRPEEGESQLPPQFKRQTVAFQTHEPAGTIIIDTPNTYLYLVLGHGQAMRYGIGVGREGFTWSGTERISRMKEWPDWLPPKQMIQRQPYLPRFMAGGETNPLGARAMYLGNTEYRIHGTNQPSTIGTFVSSGCIRLTNEDVEDLYSRVTVGTRAIVLPAANTAASQLRQR